MYLLSNDYYFFGLKENEIRKSMLADVTVFLTREMRY